MCIDCENTFWSAEGGDICNDFHSRTNSSMVKYYMRLEMEQDL